MDISQLAQCLRALVAENDEVAVPHLGVFIKELVPASFSENLSTINPPYSKIYFKKEDILPEAAQVFVNGAAKILDVTPEKAEGDGCWCVSRLCSILEADKICELPGFGRMKANSANDFFFVQEDNLDLFDDTYGLEAIHLRVAPEPEPTSEPIPEPTPEPEQETASEPISEPVPELAVEPKRRLAAGWIVLIILLAVVAILAMFWAVYPQQASAVLDRILYSKEELELIKWGNL